MDCAVGNEWLNSDAVKLLLQTPKLYRRHHGYYQHYFYVDRRTPSEVWFIFFLHFQGGICYRFVPSL